jgi:hypothetical protein
MKRNDIFVRLLSMFVVWILTCAAFTGILSTVEEVKASGFRMDSRIKDAHASFLGEDADDWSGFAIAGAGDVNGDGYDDILISAPYDEESATEAGQTYLILGKPVGWKMDVNLSKADASFLGENPNDRSGVSAAGAGDVNGDGFDDILIGAYRNDEGGSSAGQAYLIFGKASGWIKDMNLSLSDVSFWGEDPQEQAGYSVAGCGDVNADGYDDILIGARYDSENGFEAGEAYLVLGKPSGWTNDINLSSADASFRGEDGSDVAGSTVAGAGDVNGDGFHDILIGASGDEEGGGSNCGQTYLIFGKSSGWARDTDLSNADASFFGEDTFDYSSYSIDGAGDVNGDGFDDILIGAYADEEAGAINMGQTYLIFGKYSGWDMDTSLNNSDASFWGEFINDNSGSSVAFAGDVNLDGYDDILIGAYGNDEVPGDSGQAYLVLGKSTGWAMNTYLNNSDASFWAEDAGDHFGFAVEGAGDVNGDGYPDLLMSARYDEEGGNKAGQTYLVFYESAPPAPRGLTATLSKNGDHLNLSWKEPEFWKKITGFILYRSEDGFNYHEVAVLNSSTSMYTDWDVILGHVYRYRVKATALGPYESPMSQPVEVLCDYDTDLDKIGNSVDPDDDGDGVADTADAFPLDGSRWSHPEIESINSTLNDIQNRVMGIQSDLDGMNTSLGDLRNEISYLNATLPTKVNDLTIQLSNVNDSILARISDAETTILSDIADLNETSILSYLQGMNASLADDIQNLLSKITNDIIDLNSSLESRLTHLLENVTTGNTDLKDWFDIVIGAIDSNLTSTNDTLQSRINDLDTFMTDFYSDLFSDLSDITSQLQTHDIITGQNHSDIIEKLHELTEGGTGEMDLGELQAMLASLATNVSSFNESIATDMDLVGQNIDSFETNTNEKLTAINNTLSDLTHMENILKDLEILNQSLTSGNQQLKESIDEIPTEKQEEEGFGATEGLLVVVLVLLIINLLVMLKGRKGQLSEKEILSEEKSTLKSKDMEENGEIGQVPDEIGEEYEDDLEEKESEEEMGV